MPKTAKDVIETFRASIDAQINGDKNHGWGQKDSMAVIGDIIAEFAGEIASKNQPVLNASLEAIERVVNPSACRQWLESSKVAKLQEQEKKKARHDKWFSEFVAEPAKSEEKQAK